MSKPIQPMVKICVYFRTFIYVNKIGVYIFVFFFRFAKWLLTVVSFVCLFHYYLSLPFNVDVCGVVYTYRQISSRDSITQKICNLLPSFYVLLLLIRFVQKNIFFKNVYTCIHICVVCLFFMRYFCSFRSIWHWMLGLCLIHCTISTHNFWIHAINILFETSTMMAASTRIKHTHTRVATNYTWPTLSQTLPLPNMLPTMNEWVCQKLDVF